MTPSAGCRLWCALPVPALRDAWVQGLRGGEDLSPPGRAGVLLSTTPEDAVRWACEALMRRALVSPPWTDALHEAYARRVCLIAVDLPVFADEALRPLHPGDPVYRLFDGEIPTQALHWSGRVTQRTPLLVHPDPVLLAELVDLQRPGLSAALQSALPPDEVAQAFSVPLADVCVLQRRLRGVSTPSTSLR